MAARRMSKTAGIALLAALVLSHPAEARTGGGPFMPGGEAADAPSGFVEMCARDRALCAAGLPLAPRAAPTRTEPGAEPALITGGIAGKPARFLTASDRHAPEPGEPAFHAASPAPFTLRQIRQLNKEVNHSAIQRTDRFQMGIDEYWRRPIDYRHPVGDCEDLAIEKRMRLIERGFPPDRLFYAVTFRMAIGLHTILVARLDEGDYVLDSMTPHVVRWNETGYIWLRQQSTRDPLLWMRVDTTTLPRIARAEPAGPDVRSGSRSGRGANRGDSAT
jgi:predicted transglutaminase-like cysteine proteinase